MTEKPQLQAITPEEWPHILQAMRDGAVSLNSSAAEWAMTPLPDSVEALERELAVVDALWEGGQAHGTISPENLGYLEERRARLRRGMIKLG